jgi:hypothetical protein
MSSVLSLTGLALGVGVNKKWLVVPFVVQSFFLQHALQGWCPPLPMLRRLGFRTQHEIECERCALKAKRGDFKHLNSTGNDDMWAIDLLESARRSA